MALQVFYRTTVHVHIAAESWVGSRSWQGGDGDKSLIYWVHFLASQAASNTPSPPIPTHQTAQGLRERNKRYGVREWGENEVNRERERRLVKNEKWRQRQISRDMQGTKRKIEPYWGENRSTSALFRKHFFILTCKILWITLYMIQVHDDNGYTALPNKPTVSREKWKSGRRRKKETKMRIQRARLRRKWKV